MLRINREALAQLVALINELTGEVEAAPPRLDGLLALRGVVETVEDEDEAVLEERCARGARRLDRRRSTGSRRPAPRRGRESPPCCATSSTRRPPSPPPPKAAPRPSRRRCASGCARCWRASPIWRPSVPEERVAQEVALLVARSDIREELERLRAHLEQAGELLQQGEAVGRRLDFLCQELNREANTLCSKSADIELTRIGLALKAVIEQFREQVQNIE